MKAFLTGGVNRLASGCVVSIFYGRKKNRTEVLEHRTHGSLWTSKPIRQSSDRDPRDGDAQDQTDAGSSSNDVGVISEPMFQINPEALKLKEEAEAEERAAKQTTQSTRQPSQQAKQTPQHPSQKSQKDPRQDDRPIEAAQPSKPVLPAQGITNSSTNQAQGRRASMSGDEPDSSYEQVMLTGLKGNKQQQGAGMAPGGGALLTLEEEEILSAPDPWASLQTQYQIGRIASEYPKKIQSSQPQAELVLRDSSDDEFDLMVAPQPKKTSKPKANKPASKSAPKSANGKVKQGGWGTGAMAAAGTLMLDDDDVFGTSDDDDDAVHHLDNTATGEGSGDEIETHANRIQPADILDGESIEDFDLELLAPNSHNVLNSSLEAKMARLEALMNDV